MRGQLLKTLFSLMITLLVGSLLTTVIWHDNHLEEFIILKPCFHISVCCRETINKILQGYSTTWKRQEDNYQKFRSQLNSKCHGFEKAIITQYNTPVGSKIWYETEKKRSVQITPDIFSTFIKLHPFSNETKETCAVVGNGGILSNSSCGQTIDSAQFVMRCNLPPLQNGYENHVGVKTDLVTANPSILRDKYGSLMGRRRPFVTNLQVYGSSLLLFPAFSYSFNTAISLRAAYTIEDFKSPSRPIYFNPEYLQRLNTFWRSQGLKEVRLSTGLIMASLALEVCKEVHLYGFWPFTNHPYDLRNLTNHYYDDIQTKTKFHTIPDEFALLLRLHSQGILRIHLEDCPPGKK
uniref:ST8 alpha-N-acetyl-neuraminide alpha-2,8-sialyltransferase 6 n=1 Tax=Cynoglossus semilaevis TaxID=244447 RepID=A0A3P8VQQ4_CYNSE